ncbi:hypothetical protein OAO87_01530 [bacterium]|nr:hypothetical protein [bacterium]
MTADKSTPCERVTMIAIADFVTSDVKPRRSVSTPPEPPTCTVLGG